MEEFESVVPIAGKMAGETGVKGMSPVPGGAEPSDLYPLSGDRSGDTGSYGIAADEVDRDGSESGVLGSG